jgi:hypothetical protein
MSVPAWISIVTLVSPSRGSFGGITLAINVD